MVASVLVLAGDEVLDRHCVEQLHVRELEHLGQQGAAEQSRVLGHHVVAFLPVRGLDLVQQLLCRTVVRRAHDHGREPAAEPCSSSRLPPLMAPHTKGGNWHTRRNHSLNQGNLEVGTSLGQREGSAETA